MSVWLRWCLSPVLGILGLAALVFGVGHIISCQDFYFMGPGIIDAILLLIVAFHGLFLRIPSRSQCVLQVIAALFGLALAVLCALELFCIRIDPKAPLGSVCFGLDYRFGSLGTSCRNHLSDIRGPILQFFKKPRFFMTLVSGGLIIIALLQVLAASAASWYTALESRIRPHAHHAQLPLALAIMAFGIVHTLYCGTYFYIGFGIWAGALILIQATITWRTQCKGTFTRAINIIGSGVGMALAAVNGFGLFCWFSYFSEDPLAFRRHCEWRAASYERCTKRVLYTNPYFDWPKEHANAEMRNLQFVAYAGLFIGGILQFAVSLRSTFRKISL